MATKERFVSSMPRTVVGMSAWVPRRRAIAMPKPASTSPRRFFSKVTHVPQPRRRAMAKPWVRCAAYNVGASQATAFTTSAKRAAFDEKVTCLSRFIVLLFKNCDP